MNFVNQEIRDEKISHSRCSRDGGIVLKYFPLKWRMGKKALVLDICTGQHLITLIKCSCSYKKSMDKVTDFCCMFYVFVAASEPLWLKDSQNTVLDLLLPVPANCI